MDTIESTFFSISEQASLDSSNPSIFGAIAVDMRKTLDGVKTFMNTYACQSAPVPLPPLEVPTLPEVETGSLSTASPMAQMHTVPQYPWSDGSVQIVPEDFRFDNCSLSNAYMLWHIGAPKAKPHALRPYKMLTSKVFRTHQPGGQADRRK